MEGHSMWILAPAFGRRSKSETDRRAELSFELAFMVLPGARPKANPPMLRITTSRHVHVAVAV